MSHKKLTASQLRALRILYDNRIENPRQFARFMWPSSDGWEKPAKCGNYGVSIGGGMNLAGGGYLGKLRCAGFINYDNRLTLLGEEVLEDSQ